MKTGVKNVIFWSEIGSGFGEPGGIPPPRFARSILRGFTIPPTSLDSPVPQPGPYVISERRCAELFTALQPITRSSPNIYASSLSPRGVLVPFQKIAPSHVPTRFPYLFPV